MKSPNPFIEADGNPWYDEGSAWERAGRTTFDGVTRLLAAANRRGSLTMVGGLGAVLHGLGLQGPSVREVHALLPEMDARRCRAIGRQASRLRFMNRMAIALAAAGTSDDLAALLDDESATPPNTLSQRAGGLVIVAWHLGAHFGVRAALRRWGLDALVVRDLPIADVAGRARTLKQAVDHVRAGGLLMAAIDGPGGASTAPVSCLGRRVLLRRGPLLVARAARAPIVPVVARWARNGRIHIVTGEPHRAEGAEEAVAAQLAGWFERHVRAYPEDLWPFTIRNLLAAPRDPGASAREAGAAQEHGVGHGAL